MAKLSRKEQEMLEKLNAKAEAPESSPVNRSLSISVDLGDEKQVALARRYGFLDDIEDDDDDDGDDGDDDDKEKDKTPRRAGYFGDK